MRKGVKGGRKQGGELEKAVVPVLGFCRRLIFKHRLFLSYENLIGGGRTKTVKVYFLKMYVSIQFNQSNPVAYSPYDSCNSKYKWERNAPFIKTCITHDVLTGNV